MLVVVFFVWKVDFGGFFVERESPLFVLQFVLALLLNDQSFQSELDLNADNKLSFALLLLDLGQTFVQSAMD